ncbi:class F sortase [Micrococcus sp. NPDC078436]|uniref:class F sortase n=1 Tax=Micrococcus sp. NPDC078436 TaxID=3154960 RepID=UPI00344BF9D7
MSTNVKRGLWAVLLLACIAAVWFAVRGGLALGDTPISAPPSAASTSASSSDTASAGPTPTERSSSASATASSASVTTSSSAPASTASTGNAVASAPTTAPASSAPAATSAPAPTTAPATPTPNEAPSSSTASASGLLTGPAAPWEDIAAAPVHVAVYRGPDRSAEQIVGASIELTQMRDDGEINPTPQTVGWYGPPQWSTTPGERSGYPGVLAGHIIHSGSKDVFYRLQEARAGDAVVISYDDGTQAAFRIQDDAVSADKTAFTQDEEWAWAWKLDVPGNVVTLITCELVEGSGMTGYSLNNWVVQADRVA